jgi:hypothetical protein
MPRFGAIYIAHNHRDGERILKIGMTTRSISERMAELTSETSNIGQYEALGHIVVSDVDAAEAACHQRLAKHRVQKNREFFEVDLKDAVISIRSACSPCSISEVLPNFEETESTNDVDRIFDEALLQKRSEERQQRAADRNLRTEFSKAVDLLDGKCSELAERFSEDDPFGKRILVDVPDPDDYGSQWICEVTLCAPIPMGEDDPNNNIRGPMKIPGEILSTTDGSTYQEINQDDGAYAIFSLRADIHSNRLRFTLTAQRPFFERQDSTTFSKKLIFADGSDLTHIGDPEEAVRVFIKLVAVNTSAMPKEVIRGYYHNDPGGVDEVFWFNQDECGIDVSPLLPYRTDEE